MALMILLGGCAANLAAQDARRGAGAPRVPEPLVASQPAGTLGTPAGDDPWAALEPTPPSEVQSQQVRPSAQEPAEHDPATRPGPAVAEPRRSAAPGGAAGGSSTVSEPRPLPRSRTAVSPALDPSHGQPAAAAPWTRTGFALAGVVALMVLLAWGYRQVTNGGALRWPIRPKHPGLIEVLARAALSPRQSLCLVRIGPRVVLLGVSPTAVTALDVIQDGDLAARLAGEVARRRAGSHTAEFAGCLEAEARGYGDAGSGGGERDGVATSAAADVANAGVAAITEERQVTDVRAKLAETLQRLRTASGAH